MARRDLGLALLLVAGLALAGRAELAVPPAPAARVNDYAGALTPAERGRLEEKLAARERTSSNQVVVALFRSLAGESLEDFAIRLAQAWRIGQRGLDNGVIFLVFLDDRKMRIEVGYGLEATLPDAVAGSIIRDVVAPRFREGRLADGIEAGLDAIDQAIAGSYRRLPIEAGPPPEAASRISAGRVVGNLFVFAVVAVLVVAIAKAFRSRRQGVAALLFLGPFALVLLAIPLEQVSPRLAESLAGLGLISLGLVAFLVFFTALVALVRQVLRPFTDEAGTAGWLLSAVLATVPTVALAGFLADVMGLTERAGPLREHTLRVLRGRRSLRHPGLPRHLHPYLPRGGHLRDPREARGVDRGRRVVQLLRRLELVVRRLERGRRLELQRRRRQLRRGWGERELVMAGRGPPREQDAVAPPTRLSE